MFPSGVFPRIVGETTIAPGVSCLCRGRPWLYQAGSRTSHTKQHAVDRRFHDEIVVYIPRVVVETNVRHRCDSSLIRGSCGGRKSYFAIVIKTLRNFNNKFGWFLSVNTLAPLSVWLNFDSSGAASTSSSGVISLCLNVVLSQKLSSY